MMGVGGSQDIVSYIGKEVWELIYKYINNMLQLQYFINSMFIIYHYK